MEDNTVSGADPFADVSSNSRITQYKEAFKKELANGGSKYYTDMEPSGSGDEESSTSGESVPSSDEDTSTLATSNETITDKEGVEAVSETEEVVESSPTAADEQKLWDASKSSIREAYKLTDEEVSNLPASVQMVLRDVDALVTNKLPLISSVEQSLAGHSEFLQQLGVTKEEYVTRMANMDGYLRNPTVDITEKAAVVQQLLEEYGLSGLAIEGGQVAFSDEDAIRATQTINNLSKQVQDLQRQVLSERFNQFAEKHQHAKNPAIQRAMVSLLQSKAATDMKDAYEKAIWAEPSTRAELMREQQAEKQAKEVKAKAASAAKAEPTKPQALPVDDDFSKLSRREQIAAMMRAELKAK